MVAITSVKRFLRTSGTVLRWLYGRQWLCLCRCAHTARVEGSLYTHTWLSALLPFHDSQMSAGNSQIWSIQDEFSHKAAFSMGASACRPRASTLAPAAGGGGASWSQAESAQAKDKILIEETSKFPRLHAHNSIGINHADAAPPPLPSGGRRGCVQYYGSDVLFGGKLHI